VDHVPSVLADLIGVAFVLVVLLVLAVLGGDDPWRLGKNGRAPVRAMLMGADRRLSTSKVTAFAWTMAIIYALATVSAIAIITDVSFSSMVTQLSEGYLLLLGGPFAALVLAKGITVSRLNNGTLCKPRASVPTFSAKDLTSNDMGQTDLVDFQFLAFNVLGLAYVLVRFSFAPHSGLPDLPSAFAGLTSISALTYTANKAVSGSTPTIHSVEFDAEVRVIKVVGESLGGDQAIVLLDECAVSMVAASTSELSFSRPAAAQAGAHKLLITVPSGTAAYSAEKEFQLPAAVTP
jgi:hypothetical protein